MLTKPLKVGFCSSNNHKFKETLACIKAIYPLAEVLQLVPKEEVEETGSSFQENAAIKLDAALHSLSDETLTQLDYVMAEDAGFVVEALDGKYGISPFPGIYSSRWLTDSRQQEILGAEPTQSTKTDFEYINAAILKLMENQTNRKAAYVSVFAVWAQKSQQISFYEGQMQLEVGQESFLGQGFGYDPIVKPLGGNQLISQLPPEVKNSMSHRNKAITAWSASVF